MLLTSSFLGLARPM